MIKIVSLAAAAAAAAAAASPAAPGPEMVNPCTDPTSKFSKMPWCDSKLPIDERVKDMVRSPWHWPLVSAVLAIVLPASRPRCRRWLVVIIERL